MPRLFRETSTEILKSPFLITPTHTHVFMYCKANAKFYLARSSPNFLETHEPKL